MAATADERVAEIAPRERRYIPTLDGWRAIAIAIVMLQHSSDQIERAVGSWIHPVTGLFHEHGRFGVFIFFAISGFLITTLLLDELGRTCAIGLKSFYIRRAFRILPPLVVVLAVFALLGVAGVIPVPMGKWFSAMFFVYNYLPGGSWYLGHFWSLAIEEQFYLFWPIALAFLGPRRGLRVCIGLIAAIALWRYVDLSYGLTADWSLNYIDRTDTQADGLMWGCVYAIAFLHPIARQRVAAITAGWRYWALLVLLLATQAVNLEPALLKAAQLAMRPALVALLVVGTVVRPTTFFARALENRTVRWIGRISYSLYLWQQLFLVWDGYGSDWLSPVQTFPIGIACAVGLAALSHRFIEQPCITFGRRIAARVSREKVPTPGAVGVGGVAQQGGVSPDDSGLTG